MRLHPKTLLASALIGAAFASATAGTVDVSFVKPESFMDAGNSRDDEEANLKSLAAYLQKLGQAQLPANQVLKVEVLNVALAGTLRPSRDGSTMIRVLRGRADLPRIQLRYALQQDGKPLASGEEWVTELYYASGIPSARYKSEPLYYEKRLLNDWFSKRFGEGRTAAY